MLSSTSTAARNIQQLELSEVLTVQKQKTIKVLDLSICPSTFLSSAHCRIDYNAEVLALKFKAEKQWLLHKIDICFNGRLVMKHSFAGIGSVVSSGIFNQIEFEFSISDMNILFYSSLKKVFSFELSYGAVNCEDDTIVLRTTFTAELNNFTHTEWDFKGRTDFYHPKGEVVDFFLHDFQVPEDAESAEKSLSFDFEGFRRLKTLQHRYENYGYCQMFNRLLTIEDLTVKKALEDLTMTGQFVSPTSIRHHFVVHFEGKKLSDKLGFNHLVLTPMADFDPNAPVESLERHRIFNKIISIDGSRVVFEKPRRVFIDTKSKYRVEMVENRMPIRLCYQTFEKIKHKHLEAFLTTFDKTLLKKTLPGKTFAIDLNKFEPINESVGSNKSQMEAVKKIVSRDSFPSPYVIFGPPGTGKTSTLVEAIAQIVRLQPTAKILVTANSNAACDEIGERLLKHMPRYRMYRLFSPSFDISFPDRHMRLNAHMKPISNMKFDLNKYPSYQEFYSYNVIISTLVNCGRMINANIRSHHFDYIFIDECASTIEPLSLIPIVSLGTTENTINAQIVLAGDHKQLQGMVHSYFNERHGFGISLMERVMMLEKYQFPYDSRFVTQLTDNFRSHWAILKFSNYYFYHSVLKAMQKKEIADFAIGWKLLPNKKFPLFFHSILHASEMDGTSLFNTEEVRVVERYVNALLREGINGKKIEPTDIGIICPYGAQRRKLQERFKFVSDLEIGTVDAFQGREKLIIIVSTVRSQTETVGFLKNEKRLNVALTRAKALLIVIGNGETLQKNKLWYKFLNYCYQQNAMVGERFMLRYRKLTAAEEAVKKPHPIFQRPKVPILVDESDEDEVHDVSDDEDEIIAVSKHGDDDEVDIDDDDGWISDSSCSSDSEVSWTHEDFRMKAKTSKIKKWKKVSTLLPRISVNLRVNTHETDTELIKRLNEMNLDRDDQNNNKVDEIRSTWSRLSVRIHSLMSGLNQMIKHIH